MSYFTEQEIQQFTLTDLVNTKTYINMVTKIQSNYSHLTPDQLSEHEPYWDEITNATLELLSKSLELSRPVTNTTKQ